jgi:preprotein translocase subunit YajC
MMKSAIVTRLLAAAVAILCFHAGAVSAQDNTGISEDTLRILTDAALNTIPSEVKRSDGTTMKIDKSDPSSIVVPADDRRRIIRVAHLTADAARCELEQLQVQNYFAMMRQERAKDKWTEEQLLFINRLHLFTVMLLNGNIKAKTDENQNEDYEIMADPETASECSEEDREQVRSRIENYLKQAKKS